MSDNLTNRGFTLCARSESNTEISSLLSVLARLRVLGQDVAPLAAPDHQSNHGQREENGDDDEDGQRVVRRVDPYHLLHGAVGEEVLVYADEVALRQRVGPVAVRDEGLGLSAEGEVVVLPGEKDQRREGLLEKPQWTVLVDESLEGKMQRVMTFHLIGL